MDRKVEKSFYSDLLYLCRKHGVAIYCTDRYEFLDLDDISEEFVKDFISTYLT